MYIYTNIYIYIYTNIYNDSFQIEYIYIYIIHGLQKKYVEIQIEMHIYMDI